MTVGGSYWVGSAGCGGRGWLLLLLGWLLLLVVVVLRLWLVANAVGLVG